MDAEQQGSARGFPLVSQKPKGGTELLVGGDGHVTTEWLYDPTDGKYGHGDDPVGWVAIDHGPRADGPFAALLHRDDDGSEATVTGRMPGEDDSNLWFGRTTVHVGEATGVFEPWAGTDIPFESENPKRWG